MRHNRLLLLIALVLAALLAVGCAPAAPAADTEAEHDHEEAGHDHEEADHDHEGHMELPAITPAELADGEKLRVVATTNIIGDVVSHIAGDAVDLTVLIGLGQNPHNYTGTPQDMAAVQDAHIIFVNGLNLEESLLESIEANATGPIVPVSAGIEPLEFGGGEHEEEHEGEEEPEGEEDHTHTLDPHLWLDPNNVMVWAENIEHVLAEADPANHETYEANAAAYLTELAELDAYAHEQFDDIPAENRKFVTDHLAFGYLVDEYGLEMVGAVTNSLSTNVEPSAADLAALVEQIQAEGVTAIFLGTSAGPRLTQLTELLADEAGADVRLYTLYTGSLAPAGEAADTYLGMMRYNIDQIAAGLRGE